MRVLMETFTGRKGYKEFDKIEDLGDFITQYNDKITKFKILENYEKSDNFMLEYGSKIKKYAITDEEKENINDWIQDIIERSEDLHNRIAYVFFNLANKHKDYNKLLSALGKMIDVQVALKSCIK